MVRVGLEADVAFFIPTRMVSWLGWHEVPANVASAVRGTKGDRLHYEHMATQAVHHSTIHG